jgi:hypothetical protein
MRRLSLPIVLLALLSCAACAGKTPPPVATDFVLRSEEDLLAAWGDPEDLSWEEDGTKVLVYLEEVQLDHSPDLIVSRTYVPDTNGRLVSGPITSVETYEANEFVTEHRFWVNQDGIIVRCDSRLR